MGKNVGGEKKIIALCFQKYKTILNQGVSGRT